MLLNQLVTINEEALVANAVSFELMDNTEKNLHLCRGFVFNYDPDPKNNKSSTVGVLDAIRRSFHSPSEPNIHLMVQDYGKGKSHFALAVANFFKKPCDSGEVQGILQQVECATSNNGILESLRLYKQRGRHLVICLSGDKTIDLKKHFLQALRKSLESEGITDSIAQQICKLPLKYLKGLDAKQREAAEAFLKRQKDQDVDLKAIEQLLKKDNYEVIPLVKEICYELTGVTPDFDADVDVEAILTDLINQLCMGATPRFQGILILFDELYNYLQLWANDPVRAGSSTLQNITNVCENFKGRIALISFTQRRPQRVTPPKNAEDYNRLVSRLELLPSTYEPAASLELVLDGLLKQQDKTVAWQEFRSRWNDTLTDINTNIYQNHTAKYYKSRNWSSQNFFTHMTLGCFPLHCLTSYLLCNLDFTQGRTAIQFVQENVKRFILEQAVDNNGSLNFIYPVALVDAFADNFATSDYSTYSAYKHAHDSIAASADAEELIVLKALFLYYASASTKKLTKLDNDKHEEVLSLLTGMSEAKVKANLDKLCKVREVIYPNQADNTYRFYSGSSSIQDLRKRIEEEVANKTPSIDGVGEYCQSDLQRYCGYDTVSPIQFIEENQLMSSDWLFKCAVYTATKFRKALTGHHLIDEIGIVAYVIAETSEELAVLKSEIAHLLAPSSADPTSVKRRIAVAIASQPAEDIARLLLMLKNAKSKSVQEFGAALTQLQQQLQQQIDRKTTELFKSCIYYCHSDKVPLSDRTNPSRVSSAILKDLYYLVPPIAKIDKMALKSPKGGEIIGYVSNRLLENDLRPRAFPQQAYENVVTPVFVKSWRMLRQNSEYLVVQVPTQPNVKAAWDKISEMTNLGEQSERVVEIAKIWETLSNPPYGYNEYTFTILFVGWLAHHRSEVFLKGGFGIPQKKSESVLVRHEAIKNWAATNVFDKPKDFVNVWLKNGRPTLIRRKPSPCPEVPNSVDYDRAQQFIQEINNCLSGAPDPAKVNEITNTRQWLTSGVKRIDELFEPVLEAELSGTEILTKADIERLLRICSQLQQPLPVIVEGGLSISFTEQQQRQRKEALQAVIERIGQVIKTESEPQSLLTEADCGAYKTDIQRMTAQISQANLPPWFVDTLQDALRKADSALAEIVEQNKVDNCLLQIQRLYKTLSDLATQDDYVRIQTETEKLAKDVPAARETDIYRNTIQDIEEKQDKLIRQVANWENQFSPGISREQAMQLSQSINRQLNRFTDEDSQPRLHELLQRLDNIILERESEERIEEQLQNVIASAGRRLQDIKSLNNLSDAFQAYQELSQLSPSTVKPAIEVKKQLEALKIEGYTAISSKLAQSIDASERQLNQLSDYERVKGLIQRSQDIVAGYEEFTAVRNSLKEAERNLEAQHEDLQKRLQDRQIIEAIHQHIPAKANTIHLCEEAIGAIDSLRSKLNYLEQFTDEIDKVVQAFRDKIANYNNNLRNLRDRLSKVEASKHLDSIRDEYAKLDLVFKDSTAYPTYQQLQDVIQLLAEDLELVRHQETLYQQSNSVASCTHALEIIGNEKVKLHDVDRFGAKLLLLEDHLRQKQQGYIIQLNELQGKLSSIKTLKEAQKLQAELADKSAYYRESQEEERYKGITSEVNAIVNILQISETQKLDTIQACQAEQQRLLQWRDATEDTPTVKILLESMLVKLEQTQQRVEKQLHSATSSWLESLENQDTRLEQFSDRSKKLDAASQLLKQIRRQKNQHEQMLEAEQKQTVERIKNHCVEIQNQDRESTILVLFQELPREQRESLLKRLVEYASATTEEF